MRVHSYVAIIIFAFALLFFVLAAILSSFAAAEAQKNNTSAARQRSIESSVMSGIGIVLVIIAAAIYAYGVYPEKVEECKKAVSGVADTAKEFAEKHLKNAKCDIPVPAKDLYDLKEAMTEKICPKKC